MNLPLSTGIVPSSFKAAVIKPLLKKPGLDPELVSNYLPISNLPFLSKIQERIAAKQLSTIWQGTISSNTFRNTGFRTFHSTAIAVTRVVNYILLALDTKTSSMLVLLDLSAVFDTIDHSILLHRLEHYVGWVRLFAGLNLTSQTKHNLCSRGFRIEALPTTLWCTSRVGPWSIAFCNLHASLERLYGSFGISFHCYADDTRLFIPVESRDWVMCGCSEEMDVTEHPAS